MPPKPEKETTVDLMDLTDDGLDDMLGALVGDVLDEMEAVAMDREEQEQQDAEEHQVPDLIDLSLSDDEVDALERAAWIAATGDAAMLQEAAQVVLQIGAGDNERIRQAGGTFFRALDCYTNGTWSTWPRGIGQANPEPSPVLVCPSCGEAMMTRSMVTEHPRYLCYHCGRLWTADALLGGQPVASNE